MIIYYLLFPTNLLIKKKLVEKMSNLSPNLQKEIEDYLLPIPSKYEKHKNRELVKVINYLQLKNYNLKSTQKFKIAHFKYIISPKFSILSVFFNYFTKKEKNYKKTVFSQIRYIYKKI